MRFSLYYMMVKKYYYIFVLIISLYMVFCPFLYIEAKNEKEQPDVCMGPSKTMSLYFQFQNEMMSAMIWSKINEKRFVTTKTDGWLFKEKFLTLGTGSVNALDIIATSIRWNMQAAWSSITTLTVLLALAETSVLQSNTEWLWILTKDRVIVREYKQLLDIETSIMDLAYFLSKSVSLISKFEWDLLENIKAVIKKYQELWLLDKTSNLNSVNGVTISDIMMEMVVMNAYMKHFILFNGWLWGFEPSIIPDFSEWSIKQLKDDYGWLWVFWACNQYASIFKSTISKWVENNKDDVGQAMDDVKSAMKRLKSALTFSKSSENSNRCDMSYYEMAQLRSYRWWNWTCKTQFINWNVASYFNKLTRDKNAQKSQKEKTTNMSKEEKKIQKEAEKQRKAEEKAKKKEEKSDKKAYLKELYYEIKKARTTAEKQEKWRDTFGTGVIIFNVDYSESLNISLIEMYSDLMWKYKQSYENAISSDLSYELKMIKEWLLDNIEITINKMDELKDKLNDIAKYQCRN